MTATGGAGLGELADPVEMPSLEGVGVEVEFELVASDEPVDVLVDELVDEPAAVEAVEAVDAVVVLLSDVPGIVSALT